MATLQLEILLLFWLGLLSANIPNPTGKNYTMCNWNTHITDPARPSHRIPLITYYPCDKTKQYPIMVFGHASQSQNTWYDYIWKAMVPQGYIVTLPGSYEYLNDSHKLFAADMAYTLQYFYDICNTSTVSECPLSGRIMKKSIVAGHSLGGAASLLVAGNKINMNEQFKYQFTSMMTLSGCGVDSVATNYTLGALNINIPSFLMTGSSDCMCNPPYNVSIVGYYYDIPDSVCKYLGIVTNATHCRFGDQGELEDETCGIVEDTDCNGLPLPAKLPKDKQFDMVNTYFALFMYETLYADNNGNSVQMIENQLQTDKQTGKMTLVEANCKVRA